VLQWHFASSRLGETFSSERDYPSPKPKIPRLNEDSSREQQVFPKGSLVREWKFSPLFTHVVAHQTISNNTLISHKQTQ